MNASTALKLPAFDPLVRADSHFTRMLKPLPGFALVDARTQPAYREACGFVNNRFTQQYGARLHQYMPWLMTMHCMTGLSGVVGLRPGVIDGQQEPLYLEHYLDAPVEAVISASTACDVDRGGIVEIGNLVANQRGASQLVFLLLTTTLLDAGYEWIVFTATRTLRNTLDRLGFPYQEMTAADPGRLPAADREDWGDYYATDPLVVAARLDEVTDLIARRPLLRQALRVYDGAIHHMADSLVQG